MLTSTVFLDMSKASDSVKHETVTFKLEDVGSRSEEGVFEDHGGQIVASGSLLQSALHDLRKLLLQNGYPQGIINYHIKRCFEQKQTSAKQPRVYCS